MKPIRTNCASCGTLAAVALLGFALLWWIGRKPDTSLDERPTTPRPTVATLGPPAWEPWRHPSRDEFVSIARALAQNGNRDAAEFVVRPTAANDGRFLVACSPDGEGWTVYRVDVANGSVSPGPPVAAEDRAAIDRLRNTP